MTTVPKTLVTHREAPSATADGAARPLAVRLRGLGTGALPWLFLAPALLLFLFFKFIPMANGIGLSFFQVRPFLGNLWVGLGNYASVLGDPQFLTALQHTALLAVGQTFGSMVLGFALALLLEGHARSLWFLRSAVFLPVVTATGVVGEIWRLLMFPAPGGFVNTVLSYVGLGPLPFFDQTGTALWSVMAVDVWKGAPYDMVIILAGLAGIDRQLYEAAAIDGASLWQRLRMITLPALRPVVTILLTLAAIRGLRVFTEVFVLTGGGPAGATDVWMTRVFEIGFDRDDIGVASAASVLLFLVTVVLTVGIRLYRRRREGR